MPKYLFGKPADQLRNDPRVPFKIRQRIIHQLIRTYTGPPERYGLPKPNHRFGEAHPTVSGRILDRIQHGTITPKPNIESFEGDAGAVRRRQRAEADVVVYCTGYKITFPFFEESLISAPENRIELFRRVFHPEIPNVFFIGLLQPLGAIMPLAEAQGAWVGDYLLGDYALPPPRAARGHRRRPGRDAQALRGLQAPHDPGRLRRLPVRAREGAPRGQRAGARDGYSHRRHADLLPSQPLHRALPDLQQDAAGQRAEQRRLAARQSSTRGARGRSRARRRARGEGVRVQREGRARRTATAASCCPACAPPPTRGGWPTRSPSRPGGCSRSAHAAGALRRGSRARREDLERATWTCFLIAYLAARGRRPVRGHPHGAAAPPGELPNLDGIPLGPRSSYDPARGAVTLLAYRQWVARGGRASVSTQTTQG